MSADLGLERIDVLLAGLPLLLALLWLKARHAPERAVSRSKRLLLLGLRGVALALLLLLLARPYVREAESAHDRRTIVLLVDKSRSMAIREQGATRFERAVQLARALQPTLARQGYRVDVAAFDLGLSGLDLSHPESVGAFGGRTDLAGALLHGTLRSDPPPAALLALTDGVANRAEANDAALQALLESRTPVIGVGFGGDAGLRSLSLRSVSAPARVPPRQGFRVAARLEATGGSPPPLELLLLRDGVVTQTRRLAGSGNGESRTWTESFEVVEKEEGLREFAVTLRVAPGEPVVSANTQGRAAVRVGQDKEFRVLYVQGALGWDFKFISRALRGDPTVRVTGLSRTSRQSVFRQNVESADELASGFPEDVRQIAPYRVLVLSGLRSADLSPAQQELVCRFASELGGGVLLIGGAASYDESLRGSRLEQLLPVTLDQQGVVGLDRPFQLRLSEEARRSPVFTVADDGSSGRAWDGLPAFSGYARVGEEKPGATVWARHDRDSGPGGRRILIASQQYGAGLSAVIAVQNFWRWRLAKEADPQAFDRFWQQFFRFLGQSGESEFAVQLQDQELRPQGDVRCLIERRQRPESGALAPAAREAEYRVRVRDPRQQPLLDQRMALARLRPVEIRFHAETAGSYTVSIEQPAGTVLASRAIEVPQVDLEMERTARDLEALRQWAVATHGVALAAEDAEPALLARQVKAQVEAAASAVRSRPAGINAFTLGLLLAALAGEWGLRRRFDLR